MGYIVWYDWLLSLLLIIIVLIKSASFARRQPEGSVGRKYFVKGISLKIFGSIAFAIYHAYVFGGGDTFGYFFTGKTVAQQLFSNPAQFFALVFRSLESFGPQIDNFPWLWPDGIMWHSEANYFQARVAGVIEIFTFQAYLPTCISFSLISYWGIWKCFIFFCKQYPGTEKIMAISFLYFPTVVFWGSGLGKDSLTLGAVCGLIVCAFQVFLIRKSLMKNAIGFVLLMFMLFILKPYVIMAFMMPLAIAIALGFIGKLKSGFAKILMVPVLIGILGIGLLVVNNYIQNSMTDFTAESITEKIISTNKNLQEAGSAFDLGISPENVQSLGDMLPFFPKAVIATWYRPWVWEGRNPAMLLSALEGLFMIFLSLIILFRSFLVKAIRIIISDATIFSLFIYAFVFSGLIGLSTSNFGTLVRYKLPCWPFLVMVLLLINVKLKQQSRKLTNKRS